MPLGQVGPSRVEEGAGPRTFDGVIRNGDLLLGHHFAVDMLHDTYGVADALTDANFAMASPVSGSTGGGGTRVDGSKTDTCEPFIGSRWE